jgi:hypothetical protein
LFDCERFRGLAFGVTVNYARLSVNEHGPRSYQPDPKTMAREVTEESMQIAESQS